MGTIFDWGSGSLYSEGVLLFGGSEEFTEVGEGGEGTTWEISLSEILTLSDALRKQIGKVLADGFTAQDGIAKGIGHTQGEIWTGSDALVKGVGKVLEDAFFGVDELTKTMNLVRGDEVSFTDSVIKSINLVRGDSLILSDEVIRNVEFFRFLTELLTLNEGLRKEINKIIGDEWDASTFAEGTAGSNINRVLGDILTLTDRVRLYTYPAHIDFTPPDGFSKDTTFRPIQKRPSTQRYDLYVVRHLHEVKKPNMFDVYVLQVLQQLSEGRVMDYGDLQHIQELMDNIFPKLHLHLLRYFRPVRITIGG